jgi:lycopene beta-cyclase
MIASHAKFDYDFIVTGAGAAGRSFVYQLLQSPLRASRILLIDREIKDKDDRTWSFWEDTPGLFDEIVHHRWSKLCFHSDSFSREMDIAPFEYKMILAADFYRFTGQAFSASANVQQLNASVQHIQNTPQGVTVTTSAGSFTAAWCINSTGRPKIDKDKVNYLDQHFRGWFIQTERPVFDPHEATLMDFRTPQAGEFRFHYVLPTSETEALVELAIFSNDHLQADGYDRVIKKYLNEHWPHLGNYTIVRTEQGNIPMTDHPFLPHEGHIIHLGQIGGDTRASTGYTFLYIHRRIEKIIAALTRNNDPRLERSFSKKRHNLYDSAMLHVLQHQTYPGDQLFSRLFRLNPPQRLLRFLNGESNILEEIRLGATAPTLVFMRAVAATISR